MSKLNTFAMGIAALAFMAAGCSVESGSDDGDGVEDDLSLNRLCVGGGTATFAGIEGEYVRSGLFRRTGEMERLVVKTATPAASPRDATYSRTLTRSCTEPGCRVETGKMSLLPDNAAFPVSFSFAKAGTPPSGSVTDDLYFVLGAARVNGRVTEICVARVTSSTQVGSRYAMKRVAAP